MLPEFSPVETPALKQAVDYAHKTGNVAGELLCRLMSARSELKTLKRALRAAKGIFAAADRAELRSAIATTESLIAQLDSLHTKASAIYERAWAKRCKIIDAQRAEWEQANPEAANAAFRRQLDYANRERQDRRTRKAQLIKRALSA